MISKEKSQEMLNGHELRKSAKMSTLCPICGEKVLVAVELSTIAKTVHFPYPHIVIHGSPLHAVIIYLDADFQAHDEQGCENVNLNLVASSFSECLMKWSNPF